MMTLLMMMTMMQDYDEEERKIVIVLCIDSSNSTSVMTLLMIMTMMQDYDKEERKRVIVQDGCHLIFDKMSRVGYAVPRQRQSVIYSRDLTGPGCQPATDSKFRTSVITDECEGRINLLQF
ncbi:hypothetical protein BaRGS_00034352 [Batillaria attramentaria]|uniref:Uncharacterized protein n=1 Tax=Batillaria attramentaria TaxID=370345 RepID=A0ABD0JHF6_9CAEN